MQVVCGAGATACRITFDPEECGGRPCIRHYRIRVKDVLDMLVASVPESEILRDFPFWMPTTSGPAWNTPLSKSTMLCW
jgi:hypothetical protein